ncbi:MAG TPA: tetratricopeptide repeat protein [Chitinophagales bacterium]|nr:tetratricopeptide repeat protein [Chitinophagales bacterium]
MAKKNTSASSHDILDDSNEKMTQIFESAEYFFEQYKNVIIGIVIAIVALIVGWWSYNNLIKKPKEQKAATAILDAQNYFEMDSLNFALKGDGANLGFEAIAKQYSGTAAGNRARFCAGICNLKLGKYPEAIKYLEDFNTDDALLSARKFGCIADAYAEQNQMDKAIENYKKAADAADNEITAPTYLYRAALALEQKGNKKDALELYKKVNKNYPNSQEGMASEIYIAKLEAQTL